MDGASWGFIMMMGVLLLCAGVISVVSWWEERRWFLDPKHRQEAIIEWLKKDLGSLPFDCKKVDWEVYERFVEYQLEREVDDLSVEHFQMSKREFLRGEEIVPAPKYEKVYG